MNEQQSPREVEAQQIIEEEAMIDHLVKEFHSVRAAKSTAHPSASEPTRNRVKATKVASSG